MLPRMIDIARAKLPGGNVGEYQIGREMSLSAVVLGAFGMSADEFVEIVREAKNDDEVAERLWPKAEIPPLALNKRLRRITVADVPPQIRSDFHRLYGNDLPPDRSVFDVLNEDDARIFAKRE